MNFFEYHEKDDIAVFEYGDYDSYERSIDVANFVVDLSEDGEFLGLEVIGASERLPLTKEELSEIEDVEIMVEEERDAMMVSIVLMRNGEKTSLNLPVTGLTGQPA
jgi:uncharacterized protein YuzE